ncbi:MAG: recombinase family protein [Alphaproteobacteria bacterium]|nr:recombinase family protein [Alphaproteobacteria bacterium]
MALIGYARVSTEGQDLQPQLRALREAGCTILVEERASGADRSRPALAHLLGRLRPGDVIVVVRIDRLARSLAHLLEVLDRVRAAGAHFRSLSDPIDTGSPTGRLVLQVIGAIAEFERNLIAERTRAGLAVARSRGKPLGNPGLRTGEAEARRRLVMGRRRTQLANLLASLDEWLPTVRRLRPAQSWEQVVLAVNQALAPGRGRFTRDRLVRAVRLLVAEGLGEPGLLAPARAGDARPRRRPETARAVEAVARYLRGHRREAAERGVAPQDYRPPTLAQVARHLAEDARLGPPGGGRAWAPSSVKALVERAQGASSLAALAHPGPKSKGRADDEDESGRRDARR